MDKSLDTAFKHDKWSSGTAFLLATIGAAVGLGNLWRFPFMAGQNGGGAFVLIYIGFVVFLSVPIIAAELPEGFSVSSARALPGKAQSITIDAALNSGANQPPLSRAGRGLGF